MEIKNIKKSREFKDMQEKLGKLSEDEIDKLAEIMGVGFLDNEDSIDKDEKIMILSTESKEKILASLEKLRA